MRPAPGVNVPDALRDARHLRESHGGDPSVRLAVRVARVLAEVVEAQWPDPEDRVPAAVGFMMLSTAMESGHHPLSGQPIMTPYEWAMTLLLLGEMTMTGEIT